jgi:Flp pilus assembly protein TadD/SAM-dependent methyltransferase
VNRKQRRARGKTQPANPPAGTRALFAAAVQCHQEGRLSEAGQLYRRVLAAEPSHADTLHRLGIIAHQQGRHAQAAEMLRAAIAENPGAASYHSHLGLALAALGRLEEAVISCRTAAQMEPNLPDLHNNLGAMLMRLGKREAAAASYHSAIALDPALPEPHNNLGNVLLELGRPKEAEDCYRALLSLAPAFAEGHANLACALLAQGETQAALPAILRSLALEETADSKKIFVQCVKDASFAQEAHALRPLLLRALKEGWDRPDDLALVSADLISHDPAIAPWVARADAGRTEEKPDADGETILDVLAGDVLLSTLLCLTPNQDMALERLLTLARRMLLQTAIEVIVPEVGDDERLDFSSALARQCFINEYVFAQSSEETNLAEELRGRLVEALENGAVIPSCWVAALATYIPLSSVQSAHGLLDRSWPAAIEAILIQQLREPEEERALRMTIPQLTGIDDSVSCVVRTQYEENPYPRWVQAGSASPPEDLTDYLLRTFPFARIEPVGERADLDILVAGCGTGRNAIETAQRFKGARVLAIDLSLNSLAHAARKTREMGMSGIELAQADILKLGSLARRFDMIEAVGVLHHLADPFAGWRVLLSLLKPGGFMMTGLYSALARRDLPDMRRQSASPEDVRQIRRDLVERDSRVCQRPDFFTASTCRDLLFHAQEHRLSLAEIGDFLQAQKLEFLGFSLDHVVLAAYRQRFPDNPSADDLGQWQAFEADNPETFSGMYQFWLRRSV